MDSLEQRLEKRGLFCTSGTKEDCQLTDMKFDLS